MKRLNELLKVDTHDPGIEINPFDFNDIKEKLEAFLITCNDEVIVNITGGTKIMSLAAFETVKKFNLQSIYINSENHVLFEFKNNEIRELKLQKKISINEYFYLHGFKNVRLFNPILSKELSEVISKFDDYLNHHPEAVTKVLKLTNEILNYKRKNKKKWLKEPININKNKNNFFWENGRGSIQYNTMEEQYNFEFKDEYFIEYHNGKWFEKLIYNELKESGNYDEIIMNYEILNNESVTLNELDIVAIKNEKLDIFECKSGGLFQKDLNKLKAIKETLGRYSNINLVSFYKLQNNNMNEKVIKQKLNDYGIRSYFKFSNPSELKVEDEIAHL